VYYYGVGLRDGAYLASLCMIVASFALINPYQRVIFNLKYPVTFKVKFRTGDQIKQCWMNVRLAAPDELACVTRGNPPPGEVNKNIRLDQDTPRSNALSRMFT
jgi:hypothetical protein